MKAVPETVPCEHCHTPITRYIGGKGSVKKYCGRHCRNEAKKKRHEKKVYG